MRELARQGDWRARIVEKLCERKDLLLGTLLIGNNLVNIFAAALATSLALNLLGDSGVFWATLIMTIATVVFAEVLPKSWALVHTDKIALLVAPILRPLVYLLQPVTRPLRALLRLFGATPERSSDALLENRERIETIRGAIDTHTPILHGGRRMLHSVLDLDETSLEDVMTHRKEVAMVDASWDYDTIARFVVESAWTRFPVFYKSDDNIIGLLHAKAFFRRWYNDGIRAHGLEKEATDTKSYNDSSSPVADEVPIEASADSSPADFVSAWLRSCLSDPWFVPEKTRLRDQLRAFQKRREHVAIVVDEYGAFMGIATLEDVLEQIVGNIDDEHDISTPQEIISLADGSHIVAGDVPLRTLRRELGWNLPEDKVVTLAGLVMQEARDLTTQGQEFVFHGFRFRILRKEENRIASIHAHRLKGT